MNQPIHAVVAAAALAGALAAQGYPTSPWMRPSPWTAAGQQGQQGQQGQPAVVVAPPQQPMPNMPLQSGRTAYMSQWNQAQSLQLTRGFPVFPSQLSALYGNPLNVAAPALPTTTGALPPIPAPGPDEPTGWPAWARTKDKAPLPFAPDAGLLIRHAERVWYRTGDAEPFVPLAFYDKLRGVGVGAAVEVRTIGEFELLLHNSSRLVARGPTLLHIDELSANKVALRVPNVSWLRLATTARLHEIALPGGVALRIAAPPTAAVPSFLPAPVPMSAPLPGVTDVVVNRVDEPGWLGGRATVDNLGSTEVTWLHGGREIALAPGQRLTFLLAPEGPAQSAALAARDVATEIDGPVLLCRARSAGSVSWSGARFDLPAGSLLRLDPQQGAPFAPPSPPAGGKAQP